MAISHYYSQTVADGTATSVVRPSDWNSVHNQVLNMGGNTSGTSQISGSDIVWAGGNNITLSANGSTVTIVGPATVAQTVQTQANGNIVGAGFTSTTTGGTAVVATHNSLGLSMGVPAYLTTGLASNAGSNFVGLNSALTANGVSATINSSGVSLNFPAFLTTAAQSNHSHNFATTTTGGSNMVVGTANSVGATVGVPAWITTYANDLTSGRAGVGTTFAGTGINASITLDTAGLNLALSRIGATESFFATGANTIAGTNTSGSISNDQYIFSGAGILSVGISSNTIVLSVPSGGGAGDGGNTLAVAGSTAGSNSLVLFSNSPTVSFGMAGNTITASAVGGGGGVTLGGHDPFDVGARSTQSIGQNSLALYPFEFPEAVSFNNVLQHVQMTCPTSSVVPVTNSTATTGSTGSMSAGQTIELYLFSRGTGGYSTNYYTTATTQATMTSSASWSQTNSNTTTGTQTMGSSVWYTCGFPTLTTGTSNSGGSTVTTWALTTGSFTNSSTSSAAVFPSVTAMTGYKGLYIPWAKTLTQGEYVLGLKRNSTTSGAWNGAGNVSLNVYTYQSQDSLSAVGIPGVGTAVSNFGGPLGIGWGSFSATYASSVSTYPVSGQSSAALPLSGVQAHSPTATITFHNPIFFFQGDPI